MSERDPRVPQPSNDRRGFIRTLIVAELLARRGEGPLALRPPLRPAPPPPKER